MFRGPHSALQIFCPATYKGECFLRQRIEFRVFAAPASQSHDGMSRLLENKLVKIFLALKKVDRVFACENR